MAPSANSFGELTAGVLHLGPRLTRLELDGLRLKRFHLAADRIDGSRLERLDSAGMAFLVYLCRLNPQLRLERMPPVFHTLSALYEIHFPQ